VASKGTEGDYLLDRAATGPARLVSGAMQEQGTFAGAFPTQPELNVSTDQVKQSLFGKKDMPTDVSLPTRMVGGALEAAFYPASSAYPGAAVVKGVNAASSGAGGELGGEMGALTQKAVTGEEGVTGRLLGSLAGAVGAPL